MLNEHQSISLGYRQLLAHTWGPARVAAAAVQQHGLDALPPLYEAMARRIFGGADHYGVISEDLESVIVDALSEVGLLPGWRMRPGAATAMAGSEPATTRLSRPWAAASARRSFISALPPSSGL